MCGAVKQKPEYMKGRSMTMKKKLLAAMTAGAMLCHSMCPVMIAHAEEQAVLALGAIDCGLVVEISGDAAAIRQIGNYPVTADPDASCVSIQLIPFETEKQLLLDEIHARAKMYESVAAYDSYCGKAEVLPHDAAFDQFYCLNITNSDASVEKNIINSIAFEPEMQYVGRANEIIQCDRYELRSIYVYTAVTAENDALILSDPHIVLDENATEEKRLTTPDVYVLKTADTNTIAISYEEYAAWKEKVDSGIKTECRIDFTWLHPASYCAGCQFGLEVYPPKMNMGDITLDGSVDVADAQLILADYVQVMSGNPGLLTDEQRNLGDLDGQSHVFASKKVPEEKINIQVDATDALILLHYAAERLVNPSVTPDSFLESFLSEGKSA